MPSLSLSAIFNLQQLNYQETVGMKNKRDKNVPLDWFNFWCEEKGEEAYLHQPIDNKWQTFTWKETLNHATNLADNLAKMGLQPGDNVAILSKNCAHWVITDIALQLGGFVSVPLYVDQTKEQLKYILEHSSCKAIFIGKLDKENWNKYKHVLVNNITKIFFPKLGFSDCSKEVIDGNCLNWDDVTAPSTDIEKNSYATNLTDTWTILYTSGTSGTPKGVVHSYEGIAEVREHLGAVFKFNKNERFFSYLPLAHAAERLLLEVNSMFFGIPIYFTNSLESFQSDLKKCSPTLFFSVPRIWKKLQLGVLAKIEQRKLDSLLKTPLLGYFVKKKIRKQLGLHSAKMIMSGAAPISGSTLDWFSRLGIDIYEGYGLTEVFAYGTVNSYDNYRRGSIGKPLPNSGYKLSETGEILFKSNMVMKCYYHDGEQTQSSFTNDGYFKTGDLAYEDADGYIYIKGRTKEIFKTAKGEYISPIDIENKLASNQHIEQVCVVGSGLAQPIAIITLANTINENFDATEFENLRQTVNIELCNHEKLSKFLIYPESWTTENGIMTPTLKVKRNVLENLITENFQTEITNEETVVVLNKITQRDS